MPADPEFICRAESIGSGSSVITIGGELDLSTASRLRHLLDDLRGQGGSEHLAVDLTGCTFIDSSGITVLIEAQHAATTPLIVACRTPQNRRALEVAGLDSVFVLCDSREAALAQLKKQSATA